MIGRPIIVNLFAGPGTGKSTCGAGVFSILKMHNINAELVTEFAKDLTWEQRYNTLKNQYYVFGKQHHRLFRLVNEVDVIITDSPILLSLAYAPDDSIFHNLVINAHKQFNNENFFLIREKKYNPCGRSQNEDEAKNLDNVIHSMLCENKIPFHIENGANYEIINSISSQILMHFGIYKPFFSIFENNH